MKFTEFESLMESRGMKTLAEIARNLDATPQAVSNWKARNQIPYHIINKLNELAPKDESDLIKTTQNFTKTNPKKIFTVRQTYTIEIQYLFLMLFLHWLSR